MAALRHRRRHALPPPPEPAPDCAFLFCRTARPRGGPTRWMTSLPRSSSSSNQQTTAATTTRVRRMLAGLLCHATLLLAITGPWQCAAAKSLPSLIEPSLHGSPQRPAQGCAYALQHLSCTALLAVSWCRPAARLRCAAQPRGRRRRRACCGRRQRRRAGCGGGAARGCEGGIGGVGWGRVGGDGCRVQRVPLCQGRHAVALGEDPRPRPPPPRPAALP